MRLVIIPFASKTTKRDNLTTSKIGKPFGMDHIEANNLIEMYSLHLQNIRKSGINVEVKMITFFAVWIVKEFITATLIIIFVCFN